MVETDLREESAVWAVGQTVDGSPLKPGVNVDPVDISAGLRRAASFGYGDWKARMVVEAALCRHRRGEEESAMKLWLSEYPRDLTSWYAILASAVVSGTEKMEQS